MGRAERLDNLYIAAWFVVLSLLAACGSGGVSTDPIDSGPPPIDVVADQGFEVATEDTFDAVVPDLAADIPAPPDVTGEDLVDDVAEDIDAGECDEDEDCVALLSPGTCVEARCDTGACVLLPRDASRPCDDENSCTTDDHCDGTGQCAPGTPVVCDDENPCTNDACDPETGTCVFPVRSDGSFCGDPAAPCDGSVCTSGECMTRTRPNGYPCNDDANPCDASECEDGECLFLPGPDGTPCDDENPCTENDACTQGSCAGAAKPCDDGDDCTVDTCAADTGECGHTSAEDDTPCDDDDPCTVGDSCLGGECQPGPDPLCQDTNTCTTDICNPVTGACSFPAVSGDPCDDSNACTTVDTCVQGVCRGSVPVDCDDDNACTTDSCVPENGHCRHVDVINGSPCDAPNLCYLGACTSGECVNQTPVTCEDDDVCTLNQCNEESGECEFPAAPDGTGCDDGNLCTADDTCQGGVCTGGTETTCDDLDVCTVDRCEPTTGDCVFEPTAGGEICDDMEPCSIDDACQDGMCVGLWNAPFCCETIADCPPAPACATVACEGGRCTLTQRSCPSAEDGCTSATCVDETCRPLLLNGLHEFWREDFESSAGVLTWPPDSWTRTTDAAFEGSYGIRLRAGLLPGVLRLTGPSLRMPAGSAELRVRVRIASEGGVAPDGALRVAATGSGGAETTIAGPTDDFETVVLPLGDDVAYTTRVALAYEGTVGLVDIDVIELIHLGRNGCILNQIDSVATHAATPSLVALSARGRTDALLVWSEQQTVDSVVETEVNGALLKPRSAWASSRILVSPFLERPDHMRLRGALTATGEFLVAYPGEGPAPSEVQTIEGSIIGEVSTFPTAQFWLHPDFAGAWARDAAVAGSAGGWLVVWSAPNLDPSNNTVRSQRWGTSGGAIDTSPWLGAIPNHVGISNVELVPSYNNRHLAIMLSRTAAAPVQQVIVARTVNTNLSTPSMTGSPIVLAQQDPATGSFSFLRAASFTGGFAIVYIRNGANPEDPKKLEVKRFALDGTLLPPLDAADQVVFPAVGGDNPAPAVAADPDGALMIVWRQPLAGRDYIYSRRVATDGTMSPTSTSLAAQLPLMTRGAPDIVRLGERWFLVAWAAGNDRVEYRTLGVDCGDGLVRCNGAVAEICDGDGYVPLFGGCTAAECGAGTTCE